MKILIKKLVIFSSPFLVLWLFMFLSDPYDLFNISLLYRDQIKYKCLYRNDAVAPRGIMLWNIIRFKRNPTENILIADSRLENISDSTLGIYMHGKATNLALPGANYRTFTDLFWMAANTIKLKHVIIQTNFLTYNANLNTDLFGPANKIAKNPYKFFLSFNAIKDSFFLLYYSITKKEYLLDRRYYLNYEDNWSVSRKYISFILTKKQYVYPERYFSELTRISEYCKKNNIDLVFVIAPVYYKFHDIIKKDNLTNAYKRFKTDIYKLGQVKDLDKFDDFTNNKNNYWDYIHFNENLEDTILKMIYAKPNL